MKLARLSTGFFATVQGSFVFSLSYRHLLATLPIENLLGTQSLILDYLLWLHVLLIPEPTPLCPP